MTSLHSNVTGHSVRTGAFTSLPFSSFSPVTENLSKYSSPDAAETVPQKSPCGTRAAFITFTVKAPVASMFFAVWRFGFTAT